MSEHTAEKGLRKRLHRAWFRVWRTEVDLTIVRWFAHRCGWHTNACRGAGRCRPEFDARWRDNGWWSNR